LIGGGALATERSCTDCSDRLYARYLRSRGREVLFICATDEHGTPAELAALEEGLDVAEYCRRQHEVQAELARTFRLSFDHFG
jgi:methionyl-tRNA synthetase